jgi:hypothetical protein
MTAQLEVTAPQLPAICLRGWVIEPLRSLDTLKVCQKEELQPAEYGAVRLFDRSMSEWRLQNLRHVGFPGFFRGYSLLRKRAYLVAFETVRISTASLADLTDAISRAMRRNPAFYEAAFAIEDVERKLSSLRHFDEVYAYLEKIFR